MLFSPWQHEPQDGPYCIYHQRQPGDLNYNYTHEVSRYDASRCKHQQAVPALSDLFLPPCMPIPTMCLDIVQGAYQTYTDQPDCPGYQDLLRRHALQLVAAGVDHVLVLVHSRQMLEVHKTRGICFVALSSYSRCNLQVDMTNINKYTATSDAIQLRPFEVLVEEWAKLRRQVLCAA